jgi:predicted peroxiredoxin
MTMGHVMIHNTHGKEDLERASLAFVVANTALVSGQQAMVLLTIEGVRVATRGYAQGLQAEGFAPLSELLTQFVKGNGTIWVCGACAKPRQITEADLIPGARIIGAATAIEALVSGAQSLTF